MADAKTQKMAHCFYLHVTCHDRDKCPEENKRCKEVMLATSVGILWNAMDSEPVAAV